MSFIEIIQLLLRNKKWVFLFPVVVALLVFYLTRNIPNTYSSEMVIYTGIASGYNIENDIDGKIDFHEANSKFDNLINTITSKETDKEVALRFLANMIHHPEELKRIIQKSHDARFEWLYDSASIKGERGATEEVTYQNLIAQINTSSENRYYQLVYSKYGNPFNVNTLKDIKATRLGFSDMVKVEYTSDDAFVTKKTLDILSEVFLSKYKGMQVGEAYSVVKYFMEQTALALKRLQAAELTLKSFRTDNRVINYYEQTKYIADQKEDFEQRESQLQMDLGGYQNALTKIESKLNARALVQLKSDEIVKKRNELSEELNALDLSQIKGTADDAQKDAQITEMKRSLKSSIQDLYTLNNSTEGIPGKNLLDQWLDLTVNVEQSTSQLKSLEKSKAEFEKVYDHFAPMGSDLNKLERDVDVAEKEYLNLLHNLNQAKLREQNLQVSQNISVIDPADMPVVPNASKKFLLIIAGLLTSFLLSVIVLIMKEYLDESVSNPFRAQKLTGLKTATAFAKQEGDRKINYDDLNDLSNHQWMLSFVELQNKLNDAPAKVLAVPFHKTNADVKSFLNGVVSKLVATGNNWNLSEAAESHTADANQLLFVPTTHRELIHKSMLQNCDMIFLFISASKKIDEHEQQLLESWKQMNIPIQTVLVNTKIQHLEKFLGDIPKTRSQIRKRIKDIIKRYSK